MEGGAWWATVHGVIELDMAASYMMFGDCICLLGLS